MKSNTNWYWQQLRTKDVVFIETHTIFHTCLDVSNIKYVSDTPTRLCNEKQSHNYVQRHPIYIYYAYHHYIIYEIDPIYQIITKEIYTMWNNINGIIRNT